MTHGPSGSAPLQNHLHDLHALLTGMLQQHEALVAISQGKLSSMRRSDLAAMQSFVEQEGELVGRIRAEERRRRELMVAIGRALGLGEVESRAMSLNQLAIRLDQKRGLELRVLARRLSAVLAEIAKVNTVVTVFAREMLAHYRFVFGEITRGMSEAPVYVREGRRSVDAVAQVFDATG